ncbi:phenylalanine--tRNA ligase subunit alpha, partial [Candidatus Daviesbacteria bacterium]|nr:phenylalanine--tRNA ligase subunit alpha [Candidatus Daviesbacteria bacterium]
ISKIELKTLGPIFNKIKLELERKISDARYEIREAGYRKLDQEKLDLAAAKLKTRQGHLHPLTQIEQQTAEIFQKIGFAQFEAPHIDTDFNNFEVLNIPQNHPARDLWDTLYIIPGKLLLRTHTSNAQIRILKQNNPPIRMMNIGRCFRYEAVDSRHEHTFEQFELVYVDKNVSMANLQYLSEYFLKTIFGPEF